MSEDAKEVKEAEEVNEVEEAGDAEAVSELEAVVSVFLEADVPASVQMVPEGETVSFRFGANTGPRVDLIVEYSQLDRLAELLADAMRIRDSDDPPMHRIILDGH